MGNKEVEFSIEKQQNFTASKLSKKLLYLIEEEDERDEGLLENILDNLGETRIEKGEVIWDPPSDLDDFIVNYFQHSVEMLNYYIHTGRIKLSKDGSIELMEGK